MRYTPQHKSNTHRKIVAVASELFRSQGIGNVGVTDLMLRAGLTHGGFYAHFSSKDALAAEACSAAFEESAQRLHHLLEQTEPGSKFSAVVEHYLAAAHRDHPNKGCVIAALASEAAHQGGPVRDAIDSGIRRLVASVDQALQADGLAIDAHAAVATMVGAMVLSRALADPKLSDQLLAHARESLLSGVKRAPDTRTAAPRSGGKPVRS
jgi:TetR/AcrR family transcriptional regulator, transcriptional repressor for nem operon